MAQVDDLRGMLEELVCEFDRRWHLELVRIGEGLLRWLDGVLARMPCDTWLDEFHRLVANLARDQVFIEEESQKAFIAWINDANEAAKREAAGRSKAEGPNNRQSGSPTIRPVEVALADTEESAEQEKGDSTNGGVDDGASGLHWIPFERYLENEGVLIYKTVDATGVHWWRVPVKKVKYEGREVYDLRGAVEFEPTFVQSIFLEQDGLLDDTGWRIILQHYLDRYGDQADQQLLKDLATGSVGQSLEKYARAELPNLMLGLAVGKAVERLRKIANSKVREALERIEKRLKCASKEKDAKKAKQELEKTSQELRDAAGKSADAETKKTANEIADQIDADTQRAAKEAEKLKAPEPAGGAADQPGRERERSGDKAPKPKPIDESRPQHGSAVHDATAYNLGQKWKNDPASVEGSVRFNQELVDANGKVHPEFKPDVQRVRKTADGRLVVDVYEVRSDSQRAPHMNAKKQRYKVILGDQAGEIDWGEPNKGEARQ